MRGHKDSWNELVAHLTSGMLFGHEVPSPPGITTRRKNRHYRKYHRDRVPRSERQAVLQLLREGQTLKDIAPLLNIPHRRAKSHAEIAQKRLNTNLKGLLQALRTRGLAAVLEIAVH